MWFSRWQSSIGERSLQTRSPVLPWIFPDFCCMTWLPGICLLGNLIFFIYKMRELTRKSLRSRLAWKFGFKCLPEVSIGVLAIGKLRTGNSVDTGSLFPFRVGCSCLQIWNTCLCKYRFYLNVMNSVVTLLEGQNLSDIKEVWQNSSMVS